MTQHPNIQLIVVWKAGSRICRYRMYLRGNTGRILDQKQIGGDKVKAEMALKCVNIIKKLYPKNTPVEIAEFIEIPEEIVKEVIAVLMANPQIEYQELVKIVLKSEETQV